MPDPVIDTKEENVVPPTMPQSSETSIPGESSAPSAAAMPSSVEGMSPIATPSETPLSSASSPEQSVSAPLPEANPAVSDETMQNVANLNTMAGQIDQIAPEPLSVAPSPEPIHMPVEQPGNDAPQEHMDSSATVPAAPEHSALDALQAARQELKTEAAADQAPTPAITPSNPMEAPIQQPVAPVMEKGSELMPQAPVQSAPVVKESFWQKLTHLFTGEKPHVPVASQSPSLPQAGLPTAESPAVSQMVSPSVDTSSASNDTQPTTPAPQNTPADHQ